MTTSEIDASRKRRSVTESDPAKPDGIGVTAIRTSGLAALLSEMNCGLFGTTIENLVILEDLAKALDTSLFAYHQMVEKLSTPSAKDALTLNPLTEEERGLAGLFLIKVFCHLGRAAATKLTLPPDVEGVLSEDGMDALTQKDGEVSALKIPKLLSEFVRREFRRLPADEAKSDGAAARIIYVFLTLLERCADGLLARGRAATMAGLMTKQQFLVGDTIWKGFRPSTPQEGAGTLLRKVTASDIVGNREYLEAALRLSRDVAGYDFEARKNPKRLNPILFALGRPGCGKTLVAHAVGNAFLAYCNERGVPAKFTVIRKSDWASSYQNASAANLVRIFKEIHEFQGVSGIYWANIDTALASRDQSDLRNEEKANLSAAFNIFDGTLIPFDGKWFMMSDANNLKMDEALRTRIAQNPFYVKGPQNADDYVRLLREILLREYNPFIDASDVEWQSVGELSFRSDISGRGMESLSKQVIDRIQNFEYPDEYYRADFEARQAMIRKLSKKVDAAQIRALLERYIAFEKQEEERRAKERFDDAVKEAVFELNVRKKVVNQLAD